MGGTSTVVVGLGNDIAGDDAVGVLAARRLRRVLSVRTDVEVIELPWAGLALLDVLPGYAWAILLDSLRSGRFRPGTVVRLSERDLAGSVRLNSFHDLSYPTALALGEALGWPLPRRVDILAVEGESFDCFTTSLSPSARDGLEELVRQVELLLGIDEAGARRDDGRLEAAHACTF